MTTARLAELEGQVLAPLTANEGLMPSGSAPGPADAAPHQKPLAGRQARPGPWSSHRRGPVAPGSPGSIKLVKIAHACGLDMATSGEPKLQINLIHLINAFVCSLIQRILGIRDPRTDPPHTSLSRLHMDARGCKQAHPHSYHEAQPSDECACGSLALPDPPSHGPSTHTLGTNA